MLRSFKRKIALAVAFVFLLSVFPFTALADDQKADSVYLNGNIYTVDDKNPKATALAIVGQKLVYVGDDKGVKNFIGPNTKIVDLGGKTVLPGLIEGHMHFPMLGENLLKIDAFWKPKEEILQAVKKEAEHLQPGEWILGFGWNNVIWPGKAFPTKEELDAVAPNNPVVLERTDGHMYWVNSAALKAAGITKDTPNPQGGEIFRDANGEATGCLTDTARIAVDKVIPPLSPERKKEALLKAQEQMFSYGLTSAMNAGSPVSDIDNMKELYQQGKLKIRLYSFVSGLWGAYLDGNDKIYYEKGPEIGLYGDRLTVRGIKLFADGSLGSRSAAMAQDYSDQPGHKGNFKYTDEELYKIVKEAHEHGFQVSTHAIGDAAIHQVINVYEKVLQEEPDKNARFRIEHFQVADVNDIPRLTQIGIIPAMQTTHAISDKLMAEDRVGHDRIKGAYAWRKVLNTGSIIVNGSDAPVELVDPYHGLYAAVTRMDRSGQPKGGWYPEECMTREEALKSFTIWAAYGQFEENIKGSLEPGKLADFVVIDKDYMTCPVTDIKDINALMTVLGGEIVYERQNDGVTVMWEGLPLAFDVKPVLENGRVSVQADKMFEKMGVTFVYDEGTKTVTASKGAKTVSIPATMVDGKVFVPLRAICNEFGYSANWYKDSKSVAISSL